MKNEELMETLLETKPLINISVGIVSSSSKPHLFTLTSNIVNLQTFRYKAYHPQIISQYNFTSTSKI